MEVQKLFQHGSKFTVFFALIPNYIFFTKRIKLPQSTNQVRSFRNQLQQLKRQLLALVPTDEE